mgnify:CR=1 FL=1
MNFTKNKQLLIAAAATVGSFAAYKVITSVLNSGSKYELDDALDQSYDPNKALQDTEDKLKVEHVGLINDGATCYLNSLIQMLFQLPVFRKAVFSMKSDTKMAFALQRLFYNLMVRLKQFVLNTMFNILFIYNFLVKGK